MKLLVALTIFSACVANPGPVGVGPNGYGPGPGQPLAVSGSEPTVGSPPAVAGGGCFAGEWKGGGDDDDHRHLGFHIVFDQNGSALHGTFEFNFEFNHTGTEEVTGTADCSRGTAELQGSKVTGDATPTHYKLSMMQATPLSDGHKEYAFEGRWDCTGCVPGTIKGYSAR